MKETFRDRDRQPYLRLATGFLKGCLPVAKQSALKPIVKATGAINNLAKRHPALA